MSQSAAKESEERRSLLAPDIPRWPKEAGPILELKGVYKCFRENCVIQDLNLKIPTGDTTVIIGESGSGKSVLLKLMNGLIRADRGQVILFGKDLSRLSLMDIYELRKRTSMVLQNYALFDSLTVLENIIFPLTENTKIEWEEAEARAFELLEMLNLKHAAHRMPADLSGGMKKRVSFARAVITQPELVFFDEPTTGLDPIMIEFVDQLIKEMQKRYQITSVIVSHDISSIFNLADHIAMIRDATIIASGTVEEMRHSDNEHVQKFINVGGSGRLSKSHEEVVEKKEKEEDRALIQLIGVHKYFGDNHVLKGVDLDIYPQKITVIIGGSGSGKSVIIKHIIGLFQPSEGQVLFKGQDLGSMSAREMSAYRSKIGMLFQGAALFDSMTVWENIAFPLVERGGRVDFKRVHRKVEEILAKLHLEDIADLMPPDISAGQRKRVGLARAIVTEPEIMIYDEPTTGQDPIMIRYVDDMILEAHRQFQLTSIVISHDMQSTFRIADRIAMLHKGHILAFGDPATIRQSPSEIVKKFIFAGSYDPSQGKEILG